MARGLVDIAIGTDTGGSVRIPAALNGVTGFKPTQARVPRSGAYPLSFTLDTIGPLAHSVLDCAQADAVLGGRDWLPLPQRQVAGLRIGVPRGLLFNDGDDAVLAAFEDGLAALSSAGAPVRDLQLDEWMGAPSRLQEKGAISAAEAAHIHAEYLASRPDAFDPRVLQRIRRGESISAAHYVGILQARPVLQQELDARLEDLDLLVLPTVPFVAPTIASLADDEAFTRANLLALRNPSVFNFYDLPAISLPLARPAGALPVGMMLVGRRGQDRNLLALASALQALPAFA